MDNFTALIERAKAGDAAAWEEVFTRLCDEKAEGAILLSIARRILPAGDHARDFVESRDLMQSALRSGWFDLSSFMGSTENELFAWMRSILRRKLSRVVRKKEPRAGSAAGQEVEAAAVNAGEEDPLDALLREEIKTRVRNAIQELPEDQRVVMDLRLQGLNAPDIALMLGLKAETVRKRESRAAEKLRGMLE